MQVLAYSGEGQVRIETRDPPTPGPEEVLLRSSACGLCGTDIFKLANDSVPVGTVLGHEIVGVVSEVGESVDGFAPGDRVVVPHHVPCGECALCRRGSETMCRAFRENLLAPGGFSELVLVRERAVRAAMRRLPDTLGEDAAIFLEPSACVYRGVERSGLGDEGTTVVVGGGSMGLLHACVLRAVRPGVRIVLVEPTQRRRDLAISLGVASAIEPDLVGEAVDVVSEGAGADVIFDTVGGAAVLESSLELTREGGTVVLFAHAPSGETASHDLNSFFKAERRVVATYSGAPRDQDAVWDLLVSGVLDPSALVTHRVALDRAEEAIAAVRERRALKVLLVPGGTAES